LKKDSNQKPKILWKMRRKARISKIPRSLRKKYKTRWVFHKRRKKKSMEDKDPKATIKKEGGIHPTLIQLASVMFNSFI
jgi:hypothetical protein